MTLIRSLEDLAKAKEEAQERQRLTAQDMRYQIRVGMASCGIAAGARDTWDALKHLIDSEDHKDIRLSQIGCLGLCALEPIVQVQAPGQPLITYGKVSPEVARRIMQQHIGKGRIVHEYMVENV